MSPPLADEYEPGYQETRVLTKAIIPAAGRGTRVAAVAGSRSKECIEVAELPMIAWTLVELALGGLDEVCVVVAPRKRDLLALLADLPSFPSPERIAELHPGSRGEGVRAWPRVVVVEQPEPQGVVHALSLATCYLDGEPFLLTMPDNFFHGGRAPAAAIADVHARKGGAVIGLLDVDRATAASLGNTGRVDVDLDANGEGVVGHVFDKSPGTFQLPAGVDSVPRAVGRTIVPASFAELDGAEADSARAGGAEIDDVPRLQALASSGRLTGVRLDCQILDLGLAGGLREARRRLGE